MKAVPPWTEKKMGEVEHRPNKESAPHVPGFVVASSHAVVRGSPEVESINEPETIFLARGADRRIVHRRIPHLGVAGRWKPGKKTTPGGCAERSRRSKGRREDAGPEA